MSNIRDNLLRIHLARNIAIIIVDNSPDAECVTLAKRLIKECDTASSVLQWNSVKINLKTCDRIMAQYSKSAYGDPHKSHVDVLRLIGISLAALDDAVKAQENATKRQLIETCYDTMLSINTLVDADMVEEERYLEAASDAAIMQEVMSA